MAEVPSGSPWGSEFDDRRVHATRATHRPDGPMGPQGPLHRLARSAWQAVLGAGIAALALGIVALAWPEATLLAAGVLFGLYLLFSGVLQLVSAFGTHATASLRVMAFISGSLSILLGLFCFRGAMRSILLLALWIGIGWLFRGVTQILAAASDPAMPARAWQILLGVISFFAGVVLVVSPFESIEVLTVVGGCWLLALGITEIITAVRMRERARYVPRSF
ncbi:HdeD family acid-resistance protein [Streptomyces sporangiiformans]|uniref:HdeD family acid-resistance protein n=1 Tax=Streptomyces sporangiiformans TaxID=2315329 RepID=A0A505D321_9ACTN|nr:HdeD family acid-resistance protein [Streptomyces sporangiiformans]TPQ18843.1 HdeD family acid-resistance protein [Streptomyces sporangiiformans]